MAAKRQTVAKNVAAIPAVLGQGVVDTPTMKPVPHPKAGRPVAAAQGGSSKASESAVIRSLAARMRAHLHKTTVGWMHDTINPLWNISSRQAQMIYDLARSGNYAQLEYLYNDVENCSPVFNVCVTRRCSALSELDWKVIRSDERLNRDADQALVKEQIECLETAIAKIDNLPEALEHFALAAFRGFALTSVWKNSDGMPTHLECLDQWNCCLDKRNQRWLWNPDAISFMNPTLGGENDLKEIPREDSIAVVRKRQIDWPAMQIFLREAIGERDWGRFMETYGLPPVILTMPNLTSKEDQEAYVEAAAAVFEGRSGVVPYDTQVNFASESRGVNPFTDFIDHQMKLFVLLATGGTLTSLSEAQGIGSGASDAQMDVWKQIVRADVRVVSNAINKQLCEQIIKGHKDFKGKPVLAEFQLDTEPRMTAKEAVELASQLSSAGYEMDIEELAQLTGFKLTKKQEGGGIGFNAKTPGNPPPDGGSGGPIVVTDADGGTSLADPKLVTQAGDAVHKAGIEPPSAENAETSAPSGQPLDGGRPVAQAVAPRTAADTASWPQEEAAQIARVVDPPKVETRPEPNLEAAEKADEVTPQADAIGARLVKSLQSDFKNVADELEKVLALPEGERAGAAAALLAKVDSLVPDDPAMAEVIAEQMQEAFDQQMAKQPEGDAPAANRAIPNAELKPGQRWVTPSSGGAPFIVDEKGNVVGGGDSAKAVAETVASADGKKSVREMCKDEGNDLPEGKKQMLAKGQGSISKMIDKRCDVLGAMDDDEGPIDFFWDRGGMGLKHLIERRNEFCKSWKKKHPDSNPITGEEMAKAVPSIITRGSREIEGRGLRADTIIRHNGFKVVLTPSYRGQHTRRWLLTGMEIDPNSSGYRSEREFGKNAEAVFAGKGVNLLRATHHAPTRASSQGGSAPIANNIP